MAGKTAERERRKFIKHFLRSVHLELHDNPFGCDTLFEEGLPGELFKMNCQASSLSRKDGGGALTLSHFVRLVYSSIVVSYDCIHGNIFTHGKLTEDDRIASQITKPRFYPTLLFVVVSLKAD